MTLFGGASRAAIAGAATASAVTPDQPDLTLRSDLQKVANVRIYFAHQSVGANLIDGLQHIAAREAVPLKVAEFKSASAVTPHTFGHTFIGENGDPLGKLQAFSQAMEQAPAEAGVAMLKFCYVDFSADTDAKALFSAYKSTMDRVKSRHPNITVVHITAPLTVVQSGPKAIVKRILGRAPSGIPENIRREEYNGMLRATYGGREPLFDLAKVESTGGDGALVSADWQGNKVPALDSTYTEDGGHLNQPGREKAARVLASIIAKTQTSTTLA